MRWNFEHPPFIPILIEDEEIKHGASNNWKCLDYSCPCKTVGALARRDASVERNRSRVLQHDLDPSPTAPLPPLPPDLEEYMQTFRLPTPGSRRRVSWWHRFKQWLKNG
jgi:hypothetical protein